MGYSDRVEFSSIIGKTPIEILGGKDSDELLFRFSDGSEYKMYHDQDCCESVSVDDITGDLPDLIGLPLLAATEDTNADEPKKSDYDESFTWTFYTLRNINATIQIRWYGTSNGYYSESVNFEMTKKPTESVH